MTLRTWLLATVGALTLGFAASGAQAAPAGGGVAAELKGEAQRGSAVQDVSWHRRCWWRNGTRHCRRYWSDDGYGYYDSYPYYGPGIGFFFGGGGGHHGHHFRGGGRHGHGGHGHGRHR